MAVLTQNEKFSSEKFSIFSYGFRPFFLAAGIYAILPLIPWVLYFLEIFSTNIPLQTWHAHEMLFGFVAAAINGFLLTAIPNWTNTPPLTGTKLKHFFYLWLSGRIAFWIYLFIDHPLAGYFLFLDLLLPVLQGVRITRIFITTGSKRNFIFIAIIAALAVANLLVILDLNDITSGTAQIGAIFAPNVMMIFIAVIGGRVTFNFTRSYLKQQNSTVQVRTFPLIEKCAIGSLVLNAAIDFINPHSIISYSIALIACALHALRFSLWVSLKTFGNPLIWVLHLGYFWLIIALFLKGAESWLELPYNLYLHALTLGAVGINILGIMSRAALGHTGRQLQASPSITVSYLLIFASVIMRVITPFYPDFFVWGMVLSAAFWISAFSLYLWVYAPILTSPRIDGKSG